MALVKSFLAFFLALAGTKIEGARATEKRRSNCCSTC